MSNKSAIPILGQQQQQQHQQHHHQEEQYHQQNTPRHRHHQQHRQQLLACSSPYGLLQSARRRLQCSQLPVRNCNSSSRQLQDNKLTSSLRKFPVLGTTPQLNRRSGNASARKSLSMVDLSPAKNYGPSESCTDICKLPSQFGDGEDRCTGLMFNLNVDNLPVRTWTRESRAASIICRALVINSWRRRRSEVTQLRSSLATLDQSFEHFKIQIVVLRRLLDNENGRVATLAGELHRAKMHADEVTKERDHLKTEKEAIEGEVQKQREIAEDRLVTAENLQNELRNLRDQVNLLDKQIERDREKLLKSTEDKKVLLEKVSSSEAAALAKEERVQKVESTLDETRMQLATQIALTDSLQDRLHQLLNESKAKEEEKFELKAFLEKIQRECEMLKKMLQSREESERMLSVRATDLESQLKKKDLKMKQIEVTCNSQFLELKELRERLLQQKEEIGWSSKVYQFAGTVARVPRIILRTLSFFTVGMSIVI